MSRNDSAPRRSTSRFQEEDGAVALIFALLLIVLLGFAAVAVDLSAAWVERRHAQTAADVGVLSGAQFAGIDPTATAAESRQAVIDEVESITAGNLDSADWATCVDTSRPPEFTPVAGQTDCVSFTPGLVKIRVRVPDQTFNTYFAGILGVDTLSTSAKAVAAGLEFANGDILPFGVPTSAGDATVGCPSDHPSGLYPCDGPDSGNFNQVEISRWKDQPPDCTPSNPALEDNIADGADHLLGLYSENPANDQDVCLDETQWNIHNPPGEIEPGPGLSLSTLIDGLIKTSAGGFPGRLTQTDYTTRGLAGNTVDDEPLWSFIGSVSGVPASCQASTFNNATNGPVDWDEDLLMLTYNDPLQDPEYVAGGTHLENPESFEHMARCLREYTDGVWDIATWDPLAWNADPLLNDWTNGYSGSSFSGVLFNATGASGADEARGIYNLQLSPRWGWSPVGDFGNGSSDPFKISDFKPIFINTLVDKCGGGGCSIIWHAGEPDIGAAITNKVESMVSFQLPDSTLPAIVLKNGPASERKIEYTLIE